MECNKEPRKLLVSVKLLVESPCILTFGTQRFSLSHPVCTSVTLVHAFYKFASSLWLSWRFTDLEQKTFESPEQHLDPELHQDWLWDSSPAATCVRSTCSSCCVLYQGKETTMTYILTRIAKDCQCRRSSLLQGV